MPTHRAVLRARVLEAHSVLDPKLMPSVANCQAIKKMRNAIQHTEGRLLGWRKPRISEEQPFFPSHGERELALGTLPLLHDTLPCVLEALHTAVGFPID